ncbi:MAG: AcvB/VirJ family lysyl-phosphatidylglycerol hydrolase, partial [Steroidobacteraceae bacterium]
GWSTHTADIARVLVDRGAMVAGIDTPRLFEKLDATGGKCTFPDGDLENLSHYLQGYAQLNTYHTPLLAGYSSGATFAYAMQAQSPRGLFAGALTLGFCTELDLEKPLCPAEGSHFRRREGYPGTVLLPSPTPVRWTTLQGAQDQVCDANDAQQFASQVPGAQFISVPELAHRYEGNNGWREKLALAYDELAATNKATLAPPPAGLAGLPLVEVPVPAAVGATDTFAILLSGDGGWAGLDKQVAAALTARGVAVVGLDSLRYFWSERTPEGLASDLDRMMAYYSRFWHRPRAILIGYSQGANVLPFAVTRLAPASRAMLAQTVLMGLEEKASWEFHVTNWIGGKRDAVPILPEASQLQAATTLCLYGADERGSLCPRLPATSATVHRLPGGHHFDGEYEQLAELILARLNAPPP